MATINQAQQLVAVLGNNPGNIASRSTNDQNALSTCVTQLQNAITAYNQAFASPVQGFTAQAQLLQGWTFNYQNAFLAADLTARSALKAASQSVPAALAFDTTSATNTALNARLTSAKGFTSAASTSILAALASATATLAATFANQPNQNDATVIASLQTSATSAINTTVADATAFALFLGQTWP